MTFLMIRNKRLTIRGGMNRNNQAGQALVEFGFVLMLFLMIVLTAIRAAIWDGQTMEVSGTLGHYAAYLAADNTVGQDYATLRAAANSMQAGMFGTKVVYEIEFNRCPTANLVPVGMAIICLIRQVDMPTFCSSSDFAACGHPVMEFGGLIPDEPEFGKSDYFELSIVARPSALGGLTKLALPISQTTYMYPAGFAS